MYDNRNYMIFNISQLDNIDFNTVLETIAETVRKSIDGSLTFVKWDKQIPECVNNLTTKQGSYSHHEILDILSGDSWNSPMVQPV